MQFEDANRYGIPIFYSQQFEHTSEFFLFQHLCISSPHKTAKRNDHIITINRLSKRTFETHCDLFTLMKKEALSNSFYKLTARVQQNGSSYAKHHETQLVPCNNTGCIDTFVDSCRLISMMIILIQPISKCNSAFLYHICS